MEQLYNKYTAEDQEVWRYLFERQEKLLVGKASAEYLKCLKQLSPVLNSLKIPVFEKLSEYLYKTNGWVIEVFEGMIQPNDFFNFMSQKKFPANTWLRNKTHVDYSESPDMFHDVFGHIPLLMNRAFSEYVFAYATIAKRYINNEEVLKQMQKFYWFTIEFGLIKEWGETKIYGAGILSSPEESNFVFTNKARIHPFNLDNLIKKEYRSDILQKDYYQINSYSTLWEYLKIYEDQYLTNIPSNN
ncbi:MAG: hypothetical protein QM528_04780 [Phycisphaerales bacterium]|nr:hypothetical protein [Phycisphaerales bacterium]